MAVEVMDPALLPVGQYFRANSWAQQRFIESQAPDLLYSGSLGSAKTRTLCEKLDRRARTFKKSISVVGRRYRNHLGSTTLAMLREKVISPAHWAWGWRPANDGGSTLFYPNGSEIWMVGFDNPQRLLSSEVDMIMVDECVELTEEMWDAAAGRLRRKVYDEDGNMAYWQIGGATNPGSPSHFLYNRFRPNIGSHIEWTRDAQELRNGQIIPAGTMSAECICSGPLDNYENLDPKYLARIGRYHGRYYERMVLGKWVSFEGMVYDCFDHDLHVVRAPRLWDEWGGYPPPDWERVRCIDFGFKPDPFVCLWLARSPRGTLFVYRQIYKTDVLVSQHARHIMALEETELATINKRLWEKGRDPLRWLPFAGTFGDHDAEGRATLAQESGGEILVERAIKEVDAGIQTVYELLQPQIGSDKIRRARLYIVANSLVGMDVERADAHMPTDLVGELFAYRFPQQPGDKDKPSKDQPVDQHNHACDALRYGTHTPKMRSGWI